MAGTLLLQPTLTTGMRSWGKCKHTTGASVNTFSSAIGRQVYTTFILKPNHILYLKALLWGHIEEIYVIQSASWDSHAERFSLLCEANKLLGTEQKHTVLLLIRRWHIRHIEIYHFPSCIYNQNIWSPGHYAECEKTQRWENIWKNQRAERKSLWLGMTRDDAGKVKVRV